MEKEQKVWIKGNKTRKVEVMAKLQELLPVGNGNSYCRGCDENAIYFITHQNTIECATITTNYAKTIMEEYTEIKLDDILLPKYQFHPFEEIMVRDEDNEEWHIDFFDHEATLKHDGEEGIFITMAFNSPYKQCIPYNEITKCLKDTRGPYTKDMEKKVLFATTLKK